MLRTAFFVGLVGAALVPSSASAQQQFGGSSGNSTQGGGQSGGFGNTRGNQTMGTFGQPNTTLIGANVDVRFNQVFGSGANIANTDPDPFAAYRLSSTGTSTSGFGTGGGGNTGFGAFAGGGQSGMMGTGNRQTNTGLGAAGAGVRTQSGMTGITGGQFGAGGFGGGLAGGNRGLNNLAGLGGGGMRGGNMGGNFGGGAFNRMGMMGGNMGGNSFLGGGSSFLGGANQQVQQTPGFQLYVNIPQATPATLTATTSPAPELETRLQNAPALNGAQNLQVAKAGTTVVIKGKVNSESAKRLAAAMLLLEPGINQVDNQLEVITVTPPTPNPVP